MLKMVTTLNWTGIFFISHYCFVRAAAASLNNNQFCTVLILPSPSTNRISDSFPYTSKKCRHSWSFNHSTCKETEPELKSFSPSGTAGMCVIILHSLSCVSVVNHYDSVEGNLSYHRTQQHPICEVMVEVCEWII